MIFKLSINRTIKLLLYTIILMSSIFSFAKNNNVLCQQVEDMIDNGQRYMQFVFTDNQGNYTAGYVESYDDPSKGSLFSFIHPIPLIRKSNLQMQQLQKFHGASTTTMKMRALLSSKFMQTQQIDRLCLQGYITPEQAMGYYQQIEYASLVMQAQKEAKQIRKQYKNKQKNCYSDKCKLTAEALQELSQVHDIFIKKFDTKDSSLQKVIHDRAQAFQTSLRKQKLKSKKFAIKPQTIVFLQTQGIDVEQFKNIDGLPITHQITYELIDILDTVANYALQHDCQTYQKNLVNYCAHLASATQQANYAGALKQAVAGTNCCHGISHYLQGLVSDMEKAYQQIFTALQCFQPVLQEYALLAGKHALQGAITAQGLEMLVGAGMALAPTASFAVTGVMIAATAYLMVPVCLQAMVNTGSFGSACITGQWDKVLRDLDNFGNFISSKKTVACMAELVGGGAVSTPNLNYLVDQVLSLRPVMTQVQNELGQTISKMYVMSKDQIDKVYQQSVELLQLPEFLNFNMIYERILGCHFFDILPQSHPALVKAFAGIERSAISSAEQAIINQFFTQADSTIVSDVVKNEVIGSVYPIIETTVQLISSVQNIIQQEIQQALEQSKKIVKIDFFAPINSSRALELANLSTTIRQLQDLAKYTNNFQNLGELIPQDIAYLNRIYDLQAYRVQIKNFLDTHKLYFIYDSQQYFIEDIASYHIHAGDYFIKDKPGGAHSNYQGKKLRSFNPELIKNGSLGTADVMLYNSRSQNRKKPSAIYPESWSEFVCDLKAIEMMISGNAEIKPGDIPGFLRIKGFTAENLEIIIHYDAKNKCIRTHYPNIF